MRGRDKRLPSFRRTILLGSVTVGSVTNRGAGFINVVNPAIEPYYVNQNFHSLGVGWDPR